MTGLLIFWGFCGTDRMGRFYSQQYRRYLMPPNGHGLKLPTLNVKKSNFRSIRGNIRSIYQFEKSTLEKVTELRQQILNLNVNDTDISQLQQIEKMSKN